jgi:phosphatidylglycerophosphate synthase
LVYGHTLLVKVVKVADAITWLRLLSLPFIWWLALVGEARLVALGLVLAGLTDFLDGLIARRLGQESSEGARLDAIADVLLLLSATTWLGLLHPEILRENAGLIAVTSVIYVTSLAIGLVRFRRFGNRHLYSAKVAGGLLYLFAIATLGFGGYSRLLLTLGALALIISAVETTLANLLLSVVDTRLGSVFLVWTRRAEIKTIHDIGSASRQRSQAPAAKVVDSSASPSSSIPTSAAPAPNEIQP